MSARNIKIVATAGAGELKSFVNRSEVLRTSYENLVNSPKFLELVKYEIKAQLDLQRLRWPIKGMNQNEFVERVKVEIMRIAFSRSIENFIHDAVVMNLKDNMAHCFSKNTLQMAVHNVLMLGEKNEQVDYDEEPRAASTAENTNS